MRLTTIARHIGRSLRDFYKAHAAYTARILTNNAEIAIGYVIRRIVNGSRVLFRVATCTNATRNEWAVYELDQRSIVHMDPLT